MISILSHIRAEQPNLDVRFLYSTKLPSRNAQQSEILFLPRILDLLNTRGSEGHDNSRLELFLTGTWDGTSLPDGDELQRSFDLSGFGNALTSRIDEAALIRAVECPEKRQSSVFYVCGPPDMTDSIVEQLCKQEHIGSERVLCEKWW